jgi:hypothetical protein
VNSNSVWIVGVSRSGKTTHLVEQFFQWLQMDYQYSELSYTKNQPKRKSTRLTKTTNLRETELKALVLAANDDNRRELSDNIVKLTLGKYPIRAKTMLGFFQDEVILFWPLLIELLRLKAQFPVRLRPETEQELASKLWRSHFNLEILRRSGVNEYRLVRRILDLWQLAAYSGTGSQDIVDILQSGLSESPVNLEAEFLATLILDWRNWCLERGFLTYALITELYNQHLLTHSSYQQHLQKRYKIVVADDVDDYPAIAYNLFKFLLDSGAVGVFTYNPQGAIRWGLGADPNYLEQLAGECQIASLPGFPPDSLARVLVTPMVELVTQPMLISSLPESVHLLETTSRAQLLRQTAEQIIQVVKSGEVEPEEIAIIAPGLDAIARYTLREILTKQNIGVELLNDQRPLISLPIVRTLLTLLTLVYPGLGRLVDRDAVAEMLVILSKKQRKSENPSHEIDPVRAGLIADYCFVPHPEQPHLLPITTFERWDRIGYAASQAYNEILQWIEQQKLQEQQHLIPSPTSLLYLAIQQLLCQETNPTYEQLAALRELLETAQHYWEVDTRLKQIDGNLIRSQQSTDTHTLIEFIQLLRRGTITANPYPVTPVGGRKSITLATIFQYRSSRRFHRWHFWLDAASPLWAKGGAATLFGAPLFLRERLGEPWTPADEQLAEEERLKKILTDLLCRVSERVYLCYSELAVNGQEQNGPMLPLVHGVTVR